MNRSGSFFEVIWFVMGGFLLFMAIDETISNGISECWYYYVFSALAFLMYYRRRKIRLDSRK